ncbi:hypothetical protein D3C81_2164060 [compost metagenome]
MVTQLLHAIHQLYFFHLVSEAIAYQNRFNDLWEKKDMDSIKDLLVEVKALIKANKKVEEPGDEL